MESLIGLDSQYPARSVDEAVSGAGEIQQQDFMYLASFFDDVEFYLDVMQLSDSDQTDVRRAVEKHGTQVGMCKCLKLWKQHNPSSATFKSLLDILNRLAKETIAGNVCSYLTRSRKISVVPE